MLAAVIYPNASAGPVMGTQRSIAGALADGAIAEEQMGTSTLPARFSGGTGARTAQEHNPIGCRDNCRFLSLAFKLSTCYTYS